MQISKTADATIFKAKWFSHTIAALNIRLILLLTPQNWTAQLTCAFKRTEEFRWNKKYLGPYHPAFNGSLGSLWPRDRGLSCHPPKQRESTVPLVWVLMDAAGKLSTTSTASTALQLPAVPPQVPGQSYGCSFRWSQSRFPISAQLLKVERSCDIVWDCG